MRRRNVLVCGMVLFQVMLGTSSAPAKLYEYQVAIDLTGLVNPGDVQLQIALYDNSGVVGDSWVLMDNFVLDPTVEDFEGGTLGGFVPDGANEDSVAAMAGSISGVGSVVMRIDEDDAVTPTIVFRDYLSPVGTVLTFALGMTASDVEGFFGYDELVISLLAPGTFDPLVEGLTGNGDVLSLSFNGPQYSDEVTAIPVPGALLLGSIGIGAAGLRLRRR